MWLHEPGCGSAWLWPCLPWASLAPSLWLGVGIRWMVPGAIPRPGPPPAKCPPQLSYLQCPQLLLHQPHALLGVQVIHGEGTHVLLGRGWGWEGGREVKLMAPDPHPQIPPKHTLLCWVSCGCDRALCSESRRCYFPAGGLGQAPQPPKPHLICADTHIPEPGSGREDTEIGPPHSSSSAPGPATQSPPTRAPMGEGGETHLGKLGDAPGSVRGRAAVRGPPAPRPGLLHGAQGAQLRAPRERRLQRAKERLGSQAVEPRALIGCQ